VDDEDVLLYDEIENQNRRNNEDDPLGRLVGLPRPKISLLAIVARIRGMISTISDLRKFLLC
jgi:hypothetical protein